MDAYSMRCSYCGAREAVGGVFCEECLETRPRELTLEQYLEALKRIRLRIANGIPIGLDDSNFTGDKHTHCAWGACTDSVEVWNSPELHIWPMNFIERGRVAPLNNPSRCPLDYRPKGYRSGCFYKCWAFNPPKPYTLYRDGALDRYDFEIKRLEYLLENGTGLVCCECGCPSRYDNPLARSKDKIICGDCHRKYVTVVVHDLRNKK